MTTAASLLTRGYFPRELPPPFTTEPFGKFVSIPAQRSQLLPIPKLTSCARHNLARPGTLRRPLKIPNPVHHLPLAEQIEQQWPALIAHCRKVSLSASTPMMRKTILDRAVVPRLSLRVLSHLRARRFVGTRYLLKTDINQFYSSIYTHSVPWALHGKAVAKANINKMNGDLIDKALRHQQQGQTIGIPIGPDSSLIIAEVILSAVDAALASRKLRGFRYIDDYEIGFATLAEAEDALTALQGLLADYELNLNPRKTKIAEGPPPFDEPWLIELAHFPFRTGTAPKQLNDAIAFFSRAFELAQVRPQQAILRYATFTAQRWTFPGAGWSTFQALLYNAVTADPGIMPQVIVLVQRHVAAGQTVNKTAFATAIESTIVRHAPLGHGSEVAWALWAAIQFDIDLTKTTAAAVAGMEDDVVALLAIDANARGRFPKNSLDTSQWQTTATLPDALYDEHWLLAYEANRHGWLSCPTVKAHSFFGILESSKISFYDVSKKLSNFVGPAAAVPGGGLPGGYR